MRRHEYPLGLSTLADVRTLLLATSLLFLIANCLADDADGSRFQPDAVDQTDPVIEPLPDMSSDPVEDIQPDGSIVTPGCNGECDEVAYTECTCDPSDPCDWAGDGSCDVFYCSNVTDNYFDDSEDCGSSADCDGTCGIGEYNECTCDPSDPCGWAGDGYCDADSCAIIRPAGSFDDSADCGGSTGVCDGDCAARRYSECTCDPSDPCNWVENNHCDDRACEAVLSGAHFDDSSDCGSVTTDHTFGVSAVRDDLDNEDMEVMEEGLDDLGMSCSVRDTNVSTSSMTNYLGQNLTVYYHTGHGLEGEVLTSNGSIYNDSVTINVQNTVFATCLTLKDSWASAFGATAQTILGYTKVSFDWIDNQVASDFLDAIEDGSGYMEAWYLANIGIWDLDDRWAGYVREGDSIVEYSARTGRTPAAAEQRSPNVDEMVPVGRTGRLWVATELFEDDRVFEPPFETIVADPNASPTSGFLAGGWSLLAPLRMSQEQAEQAAQLFARSRLGGVPPDAVLDDVAPVTARIDESDPVTVGYLVRYSRRVNGVAVRGNRVSDHLVLLVGPRGVVAWSIYWPRLEVVPITTDWENELSTVAEATRSAADSISRSVKGDLRLIDARLVYGTTGPGSKRTDLVPAYELQGDDGTLVIVDALTGQPLL